MQDFDTVIRELIENETNYARRRTFIRDQSKQSVASIKGFGRTEDYINAHNRRL